VEQSLLKLYTIAASANVERVELALAHKGVRAERIEVPGNDRSEVRKASGQDLVPVLVDGSRVVFDSMEIVRYLEDRFPEGPPLYPPDPARKAECLIFIDWFNRVWKRPPNDIHDELVKPAGQADLSRVKRLGEAMQRALDLFEQMLAGRSYLLGEYGAADMAAFPFLKYAAIHPAGVSYLFHRILIDYQQPGTDHPRLLEWIARMDRKPRA
jgi:glutathione S-transferase